MTTFLGPYHDSVFATTDFNLYSGGKLKATQSFVAAGDMLIDNIRLYLKKTGAPNGSLQVTIYDDDGTGKPASTGPANNTSSTTLEGSLTGTIAEYTFTFTSRPQLVDGQRYHICLRSSASNYSGAIYVTIGVDFNQKFGAGKFHSAPDATTTWTEEAYDASFKVYYYTDGSVQTLAQSIAALGTPPSDCRYRRSWLIQLADTIGSVFPDQLPLEYGSTGMGQYASGDLLYATSSHHLERLPIGASGQVLSISEGLLPSWSGEGSSRIVASFTNKSGGQLDPGDAVVLDPANNLAVKTSSTLGDIALTGIVARTALNNAQVLVVLFGVTQVRVSGSVSRGDALIHSGTAKRVATVTQLTTAPLVALEAGTDGSLVYAFVNIPAKGDRANWHRTATYADGSYGGGDYVVASWTASFSGNTDIFVAMGVIATNGGTSRTLTFKYRIDGGSLVASPLVTTLISGTPGQIRDWFTIPITSGSHLIEIVATLSNTISLAGTTIAAFTMP